MRGFVLCRTGGYIEAGLSRGKKSKSRRGRLMTGATLSTILMVNRST